MKNQCSQENSALRLEEEYRRRLHEVTNTVKRQLDYQVDVEHAERKFQQEHMVQWLERAVKEVVKGKQVCVLLGNLLSPQSLSSEFFVNHNFSNNQFVMLLTPPSNLGHYLDFLLHFMIAVES